MPSAPEVQWIWLPFALKNKKKSLILLPDRKSQQMKIPKVCTAVQKNPQDFSNFQYFLSYFMTVNAHS